MAVLQKKIHAIRYSLVGPDRGQNGPFDGDRPTTLSLRRGGGEGGEEGEAFRLFEKVYTLADCGIGILIGVMSPCMDL